MHLPNNVLSPAHNYPKKPLNAFVTPENSHLCSPEALDLLSKLLRFNHHDRLSAQEAMDHAYFDSVRRERR